jgi:glucosylceramidase
MEQFSIERDKQLLIPYIKAALEVNPDIHFSSSPWTPPTWMKNNNGFDGGTNATIKDDNQTFQALALYLARFVEEYAKEGIEVKAVYPQNEPGFADQAYPMCGWTSAQMTKFVGQFMGPTFQERGLTAEIWMGTLSNTQTDAGIGQAAWADATAKPFIKAFGMQWGMDSTLGTFTSYGLPVWQSEHKCGNYPWNPGGTYVQPFNGNKAPNDHNYAMESWLYIKSWLTKGANGYMAWNMVLDTVGKSLDQNRVWPQNALLTVDTAAKRLIPTPAYYVFRHVSQYVDEGAKRVATQGGDAMAFKNPDGSVVTVLFNSGAQAAQTTLSAAGKTVQFSIPANGFATVNLSP